MAVPIQALIVKEMRVDDAGNIVQESVTDNGDIDASLASLDENGDILSLDEIEGAFVLRDARALFMQVEIGIAGERHFEVLEGIAEGDEVIVGPFDVLRELEPGDLVERNDDGLAGSKNSTTWSWSFKL